MRISCALLCRIIIDGKYLLLFNSNRAVSGNIILTPIGGGAEFLPDAAQFLNSINFESEKKDSLNLRGNLPEQNLNVFSQWFSSRLNREITPVREFEEELIDEENVVDKLHSNDYSFSFSHIWRDQTVSTRFGIKPVNTEYFIDVFNVKLSESLAYTLSNHTSFMLVTANEIKAGKTVDGTAIGSVSKSIL